MLVRLNLWRKLNPDYEFGCKLPTISNSYYWAFTKPHVHLETRSHRLGALLPELLDEGQPVRVGWSVVV